MGDTTDPKVKAPVLTPVTKTGGLLRAVGEAGSAGCNPYWDDARPGADTTRFRVTPRTRKNKQK